MKKVIALFGVMLFSVPAFALNAVAQGSEDCDIRRNIFEEDVKKMHNQPAGIIQYVLVNMADPMGGLSDEQVQADAVCYATFRVQGMALVDFVRVHADVFRQRVSQEERSSKGLDFLRAKALGFAQRVERLSEQVSLDNIVTYDQSDWVVQHILANLADPMKQLTDQEAAPKAVVYKQLKVGKQPLMKFVREQAESFASFASNVAEDLTTFADRVENLSK